MNRVGAETIGTMKKSIVIVVVMMAAVVCAAQEITVAAASDLNFALKEIAQKFEAKTGTKVKLTFGSSGNFFTAIQNGAPYDVFFSADMDYPKQLEASGLTELGTLYEYAVGRLVIWTPANSPVDVTQGSAVLMDPRVRKIAIANPQHAPYGRAAVAMMTAAGVYERVKGKLVLGENISQTAQFVQTGNADVGLIALSLAISPTMRGKYWIVPTKAHAAIRQATVVLKSSPQKAAARAFLEYVKSDESRAILTKYGFDKP